MFRLIFQLGGKFNGTLPETKLAPISQGRSSLLVIEKRTEHVSGRLVYGADVVDLPVFVFRFLHFFSSPGSDRLVCSSSQAHHILCGMHCSTLCLTQSETALAKHRPFCTHARCYEHSSKNSPAMGTSLHQTRISCSISSLPSCCLYPNRFPRSALLNS